jgi:hypothetical protein
MPQFPGQSIGASGLWSLNEVRDSVSGFNWVSQKPNAVEYLVVGGGGGGGNYVGGGGGGKGDIATAGGKDPSAIDAALELARSAVAKVLST